MLSNYKNQGFAIFLFNPIFAHRVKKIKVVSGCSVARSSRLLWEQEVAGSNPATPTLLILLRKIAGHLLQNPHMFKLKIEIIKLSKVSIYK